MQKLNMRTGTSFKQKIFQANLNLIQATVTAEIPEWGGGEMTAAAYDTAWVAMVRDRTDSERLAFPDSFNWLLAHQARDGSWSGPDLGNALLPTLAGLLALLKAPAAYRNYPALSAIDRAETFLREGLRRWSVKSHESVAFEVVAPALLKELENFGKCFEFPGQGQLLELYAEKMSLAGPKLLYSGKSNLIHSLEAFGASLDFARLKSFQAANGSYGCSPSATAAVLVYGPQTGGWEWDQPAYNWLAHLTTQTFEGETGGVPNAYPIDAFEGGWVLYNLAAGLNSLAEWEAGKKSLDRLGAWLGASLTDRGASISRHIGIPTDSDDTGMVVAALNLARRSQLVSAESLAGLLQFERETHFACFEFERGSSLSANAHVLAALLSLPRPRQAGLEPQIEKLVNYLYSVREAEGFWEDKWHLSPYYATACSALALVCHPAPAVRARLCKTVEWVLETQSQRDGGWSKGGVFSTLEETAYALQILLACRETEAGLDYFEKARYGRALRRGVYFLRQELASAGWDLDTESGPNLRLPRLWRGKELYAPSRVVLSAVLAVLNETCEL